MAQSSIAPLVSDTDAPPAFDGEPIDVNTASADALKKSVPKVGTILAQRIVEYRAQNGPFCSAEDLMRVPGIRRRVAESLFPPHEEDAHPSSEPVSGVLDARRDTLRPPWGAPSARPSAPPEETREEHEERTMNTVETEGALRVSSEVERASEPPAAPSPAARPAPSATEVTAAKPAPARGMKIASVALAVVVGLCIGVWTNAQSVKGPTRELGDRIDTTRAIVDKTRADLDERTTELRAAEEQIKALGARVDQESAERKADHERTSREVAAVHESVKRSNASTEARIQRLRDTLTEIELYHALSAHPAPRAH